MNKIILAQVVALLIILSNIICNQSTKKKQLLIYNSISNLLSVLQYILLGAYTGCISCAIAVIRNIVFSLYKDKKIPIYILIIYFTIAIVSSIPFYKGLVSIIPVFNICLCGFSIWQNNMKLQKKTVMIIGFLGAIFDFNSKAYVSCCNQLIDAISSIIGYYKIKKEEKNR